MCEYSHFDIFSHHQIGRELVTCLHHVIEGGEPLLDGGGDGPEHQDQRQVHPPQQRPPQHAGLLVEARDVEGDAVECFIGPRDRQELDIRQ